MSKILIYEAGLINNGLPLLRRQYFESDELKTSPILVGGFLSAIQQFTASTFKDIPTLLKMEKYMACLEKISWSTENILLYAICDGRGDPKPIQKALSNINAKLMNWKDELQRISIDMEEYEGFHPIFDEEFVQLNRDYTDRFLGWLDVV
ncbi:MAG: hypothetical protein JSW11_05800 [Candidatus Heimdallarchaeota archaeon]|nr:MAG: hypothetical protein JSW11_05800 [Candidatus Heimdallarchaeota archaeon]